MKNTFELKFFATLYEFDVFAIAHTKLSSDFHKYALLHQLFHDEMIVSDIVILVFDERVGLDFQLCE